MNKFFAGLLAVVTLTSAGVGAEFDKLEQSMGRLAPGTYQLEWDPQVTVCHFYCVQQSMNYSLIKIEPSFVSAHPERLLFRVDSLRDEEAVGVILDASKGTGTRYDTAYIDSNRNWDISDDEPVTSKINTISGYPVMATDWVDIPSHQGAVSGDHCSYPIQVRYVFETGGKFPVGLQRRGGWKGVASSSSGKVAVTLLDTNANGTYGDRVATDGSVDLPSRFADVVLLKPATEDASDGASSPGCGYLLQNACQIGGCLYAIKASDIGDRLTIGEYTGKTGTIKIIAENIGGEPTGVSSATLSGDNGKFKITEKDSGEAQVPEGNYVAFATIKPHSERGMALVCKLTKPVDVVAGQCTNVSLNGSVKAEIVLIAEDANRPYEKMDFRITIGDVAVITSASQVHPELGAGFIPVKAQYFDSNNKLALETFTSGEQKFGCFLRSFNKPKLTPGQYTLHLVMDTYSTVGVIKAERTVVVK